MKLVTLTSSYKHVIATLAPSEHYTAKTVHTKTCSP